MHSDTFPNLFTSIISEIDEWDATCLGYSERPTLSDLTICELEKDGSVYIEDGVLWVEYVWPETLVANLTDQELEGLQKLAKEEDILFDPDEKYVAAFFELNPAINPFKDLYAEKLFFKQIELLLKKSGEKWEFFQEKIKMILRN
ncbi:MAG: hypothetical protein ACFFBD_06060 [Candidatus Hodarchaeota archaeon]